MPVAPDLTDDAILKHERQVRYDQIRNAEQAQKTERELCLEMEALGKQLQPLLDKIEDVREARKQARLTMRKGPPSEAWLQYHPPAWITLRLQALVAEQTGMVETMQPLETRIDWLNRQLEKVNGDRSTRIDLEKKIEETKAELQPLQDRCKEIRDETNRLTRRAKTEAWPEPE